MTVETETRVQTAELLTFQPASSRGLWMFKALATTAKPVGITVHQTTVYDGTADVLMLWGPGAPDRVDPMQRQVAAGRHVVAFDLAYWHRAHKLRCSIDAPHPQQWVMKRDWPATRLVADRIKVRDVWDPQGPVLVAGIGHKARVQYGEEFVDAWEAEMVAACQTQGYRELRYRPKLGSAGPPAQGTTLGDWSTVPIEQALVGASLVITLHSNVAVDAIRAGIPVVCRDGAAAAVCPSVVTPQQRPLPKDLRLRFLRNLAWFQWAPTPEDVRGFWPWLQDLLA